MINLSFTCNKPRAYEVLHWQHCRQCGAYVKIDNDCMHEYNLTFYFELAAIGWMKTITQIQTHTGKSAYYSQQPVGRLYGKTPQQVMVGWTFTQMLTTVLMKQMVHRNCDYITISQDVIGPYHSLTHRSRSTATRICIASFASWTSQCAPLRLLPLRSYSCILSNYMYTMLCYYSRWWIV